MMLQLMIADDLKSDRTPEQVDAFESALAEAIMATPMYGAFGVDYHPDRILQDAARIAGLTVDGALPIKTLMWIDATSVRVAEGYGKPPIDVPILTD